MSVFDSYRSSGDSVSFADRVSRSQDSWGKEDKKRKKKEEDYRKRESQRQAEASKAENKKKGPEFNPLGFISDISRPVSKGGANVFADAGDFVRTEIVEPTYKSGKTAYEQSKVSITAKNKGAGVAGSKDLSKLADQYKDDLKKGEITRKQYDSQVKKIKAYGAKTDKAVKKAEKETGIKMNQDEGAIAALETLTNLSGTGVLAKWAGKKAIKTGENVVKNVTKKKSDIVADSLSTKDKVLGSKPVEFLFGDKKPVADAFAKVKASKKTPDADTLSDGAGVQRSASYQIDTTKPRVTAKEAETKLKRAGYTTEESKKILEDVLPEKGLTMPGSPKKVGYKEDKILEAAKDFEKTPNVEDIVPNQIIDETAAQYKSADDYINEAVEGAWKQNKKGAGTNIIHKNMDEVGVGSDALKGTRVSENNPYYRAVFEETGRAPTKQRIKQDITDFLSGKDNAAKYLLDPDERGVVDIIREREASLATKTDAPEGVIPTDGSNLTPLAAKGEAVKGTSKLAASTKEEALKEKLIKKTEAAIADTPQYNKADMKQQAEYATNLIKTAPEDAIDIAMGRKSPPEHILQQMVYNAVEDHAKKIGGDKGANLLLQLSRSRQSTNLTKMGQEIRAAAERDPHSPVTMMDEVKLARAEAAKKRGKDLSKATKADAAAIKKATPKVKKETWESFVKELEC